MSVIALIPVKGLDTGKQRLTGCLSMSLRSRLIQLMLEDVLEAARAARGFDEIWIVSDDERIAPAGCRWIRDAACDPNTAVSAAARRAERRADSVVVVAADLPLATGCDIAQLIGAARSHSVIIVPDAHGTGTSALALSPPAAMVPQFGRDSCRRHEVAARARGLTADILHLPSLAPDIDECADLDRLVIARPDRYGFLAELRESA